MGMKTMLKIMQKKNSGVPEEILPLFEGIIQKYDAGHECDKEFNKAMEEHLTKEQRFRLFEQNGGCMGTGRDKKRKAFAFEHACMALDERLAVFAETFGRQAVLNNDNTISVTFNCSHRYFKVARKKGDSFPLPPIESYFERCAGGRLYELQKALGIKLKIKSVDISSLEEDFDNPVVYTFEIEER